MPVPSSPEQLLATVDRSGAPGASERPVTDSSVPRKPESKQVPPKKRRTKQSRRAAVPKPPAARDVIFPEAASHAVAQIWKDLESASVDQLPAVMRGITFSSSGRMGTRLFSTHRGSRPSWPRSHPGMLGSSHRIPEMSTSGAVIWRASRPVHRSAFSGRRKSRSENNIANKGFHSNLICDPICHKIHC